MYFYVECPYQLVNDYLKYDELKEKLNKYFNQEVINSIEITER